MVVLGCSFLEGTEQGRVAVGGLGVLGWRRNCGREALSYSPVGTARRHSALVPVGLGYATMSWTVSGTLGLAFTRETSGEEDAHEEMGRG